MRIINNYKIFSYDIYDLAFFFVNNEKRTQKRILKTYIINMREYDLIFNYFWIYDIDSNIY